MSYPYTKAEPQIITPDYVAAHILNSVSCTHGAGFTYDFCPVVNLHSGVAIILDPKGQPKIPARKIG